MRAALSRLLHPCHAASLFPNAARAVASAPALPSAEELRERLARAPMAAGVRSILAGDVADLAGRRLDPPALAGAVHEMMAGIQAPRLNAQEMDAAGGDPRGGAHQRFGGQRLIRAEAAHGQDPFLTNMRCPSPRRNRD